jgi:hypothetical protein
MVVKRYEWSPDVCKCELDFEINTDVPNTYFPRSIIKTCPNHTGITDVNILWDSLRNENHRVQHVMEQLQDPTFLDKLTQIVSDNDGVFVLEWSGFNVILSLVGQDENMVLNVDLTQTSLSEQKKSSIQTWADNQYGSGKVVIV